MAASYLLRDSCYREAMAASTSSLAGRYWRLQGRDIVIRPVLIERSVGLRAEILEQGVEGEFLLDA